MTRKLTVDIIRQILKDNPNYIPDDEDIYKIVWVDFFERLRKEYETKQVRAKNSSVSEKGKVGLKYCNDIEDRFQQTWTLSQVDADWIRLNAGWFMKNRKSWKDVEFPEFRIKQKKPVPLNTMKQEFQFG
jgi:hypothetical protein